MPTFVGAGPTGPYTPGASAVKALGLVGAEFRFLDPPGPGAHARLAVTLTNRSNVPSAPVVVGVPADWFDRYAISGAIPPFLDDRSEDDGYRSFIFPGAAPGADATLELHVISAGEEGGAPTVRLALRDGESLGELHPETVAPPLRPGPVQALSVPRLGIRSEVVDTSWEPPPFIAGQISGTAALGEGNSVLVGHRNGRAGDIFARLVGARLGDEVVAASRGAEQRYIVSVMRVLPDDDSTPIGPTETPRLTLMTCTGAWDPLTGNYSHRLWVIAEPPSLARATLAATAERASQVAAASASPGEAARARADAALARAALLLMDAKPRARP